MTDRNFPHTHGESFDGFAMLLLTGGPRPHA